LILYQDISAVSSEDTSPNWSWFSDLAKGEALADSDLDLLVVSERLRGIPFLERGYTLLAEPNLPFSADVPCYTPEEFPRKRRELGIVSQALEEGLRL
jgi:predicted nucleotidyltransferase